MKALLTKLSTALPPGTIAVAGGTVVLGAASYVHLGLAGHSLSTDDMANVSVLWTIVMSIGLGVFFPVEQELTRIVAARKVEGKGAAPVLRRATVMTSAMLGVTLLALVVGVNPLANWLFHGNRSLVAALGGAFLGMAVGYLTRGILAGLGHFGAYGTQLAVDGGLRIALAVGCMVAGVHSALAFSLILAVAPVIATLVTLPAVLKAVRPGPAIAWGELTGGLGMLIASTLLAQVVVNASVFGAKLLDGGNSALIAALLNAGQLARVPLFVFGSLQASLLSGLSAAFTAGDRKAFSTMLRRIAVIVGLLGLAGGIPATALGPWLIQLLFKAQPVLGSFDFFLLSAGTVAYMFAMVLGQALMVIKRHNLQLLCWVIGIAVLTGVTFAPGAIGTRVILAYALGSLATVLGMLTALRLSFPANSRPAAEEQGRQGTPAPLEEPARSGGTTAG